ncbi:MAG: DNA-protecting protein DprA [Spirochaetaceae bacterium]|nr:DNA-protecting protein DprA [Spirochaetaceae bacterium]
MLDLIISRIPGIRSGSRIVLCEKFNNESEFTSLSEQAVEKICAAEHKKAVAMQLFGDETKNWNMSDIVSRAEKDAALMKSRGIRWTSIVEKSYPPLLREIYDPPAVLFYRGTLPPPETPAAAIIGTRRPCPAANRWAYTTARELSQAGIVVVSGMALGIDAMAHRGCVDAASAAGFYDFSSEGGTESSGAPAAAPTVAVLGSSVDEVYPATNRCLARRIVETGGVLLSEYPPGTPPAKWRYPARNRIISGLCLCSIVVEAGEKSGALITAGFALEQNRDLYVAGGATAVGANAAGAGVFGATAVGANAAGAGVFDANANDASAAGVGVFGAGAQKLAGEGAKIVRNSRDILAELAS